MNIKSNNQFIRISRRYEGIAYTDATLQDICQLGRRILISLLITSVLTYSGFGVVILLMAFSGIMIAPSHIVLGLSALCGIILIALGLIWYVIWLIMVKIRNDTNSKVYRFFIKIFSALGDQLCTEYDNNTKFSPVLHRMATGGIFQGLGVYNRCDYVFRILFGTLFLSGCVFVLIGMMLDIVHLFIPVFDGDSWVGVSMTVGMIAYVCVVIWLFIKWWYEYAGRNDSDDMSDNCDVVNEIIKSKNSKFCAFINIVERDNED